MERVVVSDVERISAHLISFGRRVVCTKADTPTMNPLEGYTIIKTSQDNPVMLPDKASVVVSLRVPVYYTEFTFTYLMNCHVATKPAYYSHLESDILLVITRLPAIAILDERNVLVVTRNNGEWSFEVLPNDPELLKLLELM